MRVRTLDDLDSRVRALVYLGRVLLCFIFSILYYWSYIFWFRGVLPPGLGVLIVLVGGGRRDTSPIDIFTLGCSWLVYDYLFIFFYMLF